LRTDLIALSTASAPLFIGSTLWEPVKAAISS
jgi:hypothetical protein